MNSGATLALTNATLTVTNAISNSGSITVSGASPSSVGAIVNEEGGSITINDGAKLTAGNITSGSISIGDGAKLTADDITNGTITIGGTVSTAASPITVNAGHTISGSSIVLDSGLVLDPGASDTITLIDGALTLSGDGCISVYNGSIDPANKIEEKGKFGDYTLVTKGGTGLYLTTETQATLYVYESDAAAQASGHIYGYNAFGSVETALRNIATVTSAIVVESAPAGEVLSDDLIATFSVDAAISGAAISVAGAGRNLILRGDDGKTITIKNSIDAGSASIVLNYGKKSTAVVDSTVSLAGNEVQIDGNATVNGTLTASSLLWLRNGYSTDAVEDTNEIALKNNASASTVLITSGKVTTTSGVTVSAKSLVLGTYVPSEHGRDDVSGRAVTVLSTASTWTFSSNMLATGSLEDTFTLNGGLISFAGGASSIWLDRGEGEGYDNKQVANDTVLIENAHFTLNLNSGAKMTAVKVSNAGTISLKSGSTVSAASITNNADATVSVTASSIGATEGITNTGTFTVTASTARPYQGQTATVWAACPISQHP